MKRLTLFCLILLLAAPVVAGGLVNNGDGTSTLTTTGANKFPMGICGLVEGWAPPTTLTCNGTWRGKTWVELGQCTQEMIDLGECSVLKDGVCTQDQADNGEPLPTQLCTQGLVDAGACLDGWQNDPKVTIPQAGKCAPVAFWYIISTTATHGRNGLKKLNEQRKQAQGDTSGEWN